MVVTFREHVEEFPFEQSESRKKQSFSFNLVNQRLSGNQPILSANWAISITAFFGFLFLGIAMIMNSANNAVFIRKIRYDNVVGNSINFEILEDVPNPIYFYYELRNHNRVLRKNNNGYCANQLFLNYAGASAECDGSESAFKNYNFMCENQMDNMFALFFDKYCGKSNRFYAPMGSTASFIFNDSFHLSYDDTAIKWSEDGLISEKLKYSFAEPEEGIENLCQSEMFNNTIKARNWDKHICELGGYRNSSFIIWIQKVAYKNFKKAYRVLDSKEHPNGLKKGTYRLFFDRNYKYPEMQKYFWILHPSWMGSTMYFLEYMYLIVGISLMSLTIWLVFFQIYMNKW